MTNQSENRVPVLAPDGEPLTPCRPARARQMVDEGEAIPFKKEGVFCIRLQREPSGRETPYTVCGIDPGSKAEAFTVKSTESTYINIQTEARTGISKKLKERKKHRVRRRGKGPNREVCRHDNRNMNAFLPPSTKARWEWKIKISKWLKGLFPISTFVVEDLTEPKNMTFNPMKRGKNYFYDALSEIGDLRVIESEKVAYWRDSIDLDKSTSNKTEVAFFKHCVDSWMLAWLETNCPFDDQPSTKDLYSLAPIDLQKRSFPKRESSECQTDFPFKRGALVEHDDHGVCYIGDHPEYPTYGALRSFEDGDLISRHIDADKCDFLTFIRWTCRATF